MQISVKERLGRSSDTTSTGNAGGANPLAANAANNPVGGHIGGQSSANRFESLFEQRRLALDQQASRAQEQASLKAEQQESAQRIAQERESQARAAAERAAQERKAAEREAQARDAQARDAQARDAQARDAQARDTLLDEDRVAPTEEEAQSEETEGSEAQDGAHTPAAYLALQGTAAWFKAISGLGAGDGSGKGNTASSTGGKPASTEFGTTGGSALTGEGAGVKAQTSIAGALTLLGASVLGGALAGDDNSAFPGLYGAAGRAHGLGSGALAGFQQGLNGDSGPSLDGMAGAGTSHANTFTGATGEGAAGVQDDAAGNPTGTAQSNAQGALGASQASKAAGGNGLNGLRPAERAAADAQQLNSATGMEKLTLETSRAVLTLSGTQGRDGGSDDASQRNSQGGDQQGQASTGFGAALEASLSGVDGKLKGLALHGARLSETDGPGLMEKLNAKLSETLSGHISEQDGVRRAHLELEDATLGKIQIELSVENGRIRLHMQAEQESAQKLLQNGRQQLEQELAQKQYHLEQFTVGGQAGNQASRDGRGKAFQRSESADSDVFTGRKVQASTPSPLRRAVHEGHLDLMA